MTAKELKQKYLEFFERHGHQIIPGASLIPENDPTVLFTTAGMHPLVPYLLGEKHPAGTRLADVQKCIRTGDIDSVGDDWHLTFFEMLGNWSLGDPKDPKGIGAGYFKKEAIEMSFEFLTKELNIPLEKLAVSCFAGDDDAPKDEESASAWRSLGISDKRIAFLSKEDNWWPAGGKMPGPQGPDTEMFYWNSDESAPEDFDPQDKRWVEIWNDVFMQYNKAADGSYQPLVQQNVDTGMGLERTVAILNGKKSVYEIEPLLTVCSQVTALFESTLEELEAEQTKAVRIIADHLRAAVFILAESVAPSNVERGYVLRRLIRRAIRYGKQLGIKDAFTAKVAEVVIAQMGGFYKELREQRDFIIDELNNEEEKFSATLENGLKKFEKLKIDEQKKISGQDAFILFSTYGFPLEITKDLATERGWQVDEENFNLEFAKHQDISRKGAEQKFKGGLADNSEVTAKMHTATHLMLAALRRVLGDHVYQKGANITSERIRFDFSHGEKMTAEQIKQVEDLVNEQINKKIPVVCEEMTLEEAKERGAMGVFKNKYGERVKVYTVGDPSAGSGQVFSKEICGGPHAANTGDLGHFKIQKEESSSAGVRRIKAVLE
ncbi:MAG: alanine--tRNA ligase [Patescibacteria group bacterium]